MKLSSEKILRYKDYMAALGEADAWRADMATTLQRKLPVEVQNGVFESLAVAVLPESMHFHMYRGRKTEGDRFKVPPHFPGISTLGAVTSLVLSGLSRMRTLKPNSTRPAVRRLTGRSDTVYDISHLMPIFGVQVKEAIIKSVTVKHMPEFPTQGNPDRIPIPRSLRGHENHIVRLYLTIEAISPPDQLGYNAYRLFAAREGLPSIMQYAKNLKSLTVKVVDRHSALARLYRPPSPFPIFNRPTAEMGEIVESMRKLTALKERLVCYSAYREYKGFCGRVQAKWSDATTLDAIEAAQQIVRSEGYEILV